MLNIAERKLYFEKGQHKTIQMAEQVGLLYNFKISTCQNVAVEEMVVYLVLEARNGVVAFFW